MKTAMKIMVQGSVQGIFYSNFIKNSAEKNNLRGYFRNIEDGKVEILVEGDEIDVQAFFDEIKVGPKYSQIRNIKTENKKWSGEFKTFKILKF